MPLIAGLTAAALATSGLGLPGLELLRRRGDRLLAAGIGLGTAGLAVTALTAWTAGWSASPARVAPFAAGTALGWVLLLAGLLRVAGAPQLVRQVLDGVLTAGCALYIGWALVIEPSGRGYLAGELLVWPDVLALGVLCVLLVTVWRAARSPGSRVPLLLTCTSLIFVMGAGLALIAALRHRGGPAVAVAGVLFGGAQLALCLSVRRIDPAARRAPRTGSPATGHGLVITWLPVSAVVLAAATRMAVLHNIDNASALIASFIGMTLCARQACALHEARGYADRLTREQALLRELANTDALTGLGNRRALMRMVPGDRYTLLAIDLDGFKNVNDVRGHEAGDAVLVEVASRIRSRLRSGDQALRLGGDEFAVLVSAGPGEGERVADQLRGLIARPYLVDGSTVFLSGSVGLASGDSAPDIAGVLRNADVALRFAKERGKNRVERYDAAYARWLGRRDTLERELRGAVERGELSLVYQPVVALPGGRPVGAEALVRWHHPRLGTVPPAEFIPVAEESGLIARLDRWVLHEACHQLARWLSDGYDVWLSVNISVRELRQPSYVPEVAEAVRMHRLPAGRLVLEVSEHALALGTGRGRPDGELVDRLAALRAAGVRVALDDFGAGYSSLGQLRRLPADMLKIDSSLVSGLSPAADGPHGRSPVGGLDVPLVDAVARLGRRMGLEVVAEGVAEPAQRVAVETVGCPLGQGDLFCRPLPAERVEALFQSSLQPVIQYVGQVDSAREMRQS